MSHRQRILREIALAIERGFLDTTVHQQAHHELDEQIAAELPDLSEMRKGHVAARVEITPEGRWSYE